MKILFIGYSNLFKNRILPILDSLDFIDSICIAKYKNQSWDDSYKMIKKPIELYDNYEGGIKKSNASVAYISTTNNSHYFWAKETLNAGMHTIIDKPATIYLIETEDILNIAKQKKLLLAESTVYLFHPQFETIKEIFTNEKSTPKLLTAFFSFPLLDKSNFRYHKELGGGAFLDTSAYAVSIGRYFFNEIQESSFYSVNESVNEGLEISYSILLKYSNNRSMIGHFGFNTEYINRINLIGEHVIIDIDRVFTIPETLSNQINVRANNKSYEVFAPCANTFGLFLNKIGESIKKMEYKRFYDDMLFDAHSRNLIINKIK